MARTIQKHRRGSIGHRGAGPDDSGGLAVGKRTRTSHLMRAHGAGATATPSKAHDERASEELDTGRQALSELRDERLPEARVAYSGREFQRSRDAASDVKRTFQRAEAAAKNARDTATAVAEPSSRATLLEEIDALDAEIEALRPEVDDALRVAPAEAASIPFEAARDVDVCGHGRLTGLQPWRGWTLERESPHPTSRTGKSANTASVFQDNPEACADKRARMGPLASSSRQRIFSVRQRGPGAARDTIARGSMTSRTSLLHVLLASIGVIVLGTSCGWDVNPEFCCETSAACVAGGSPEGMPVPCTDPDRPVCDDENRQCVPDSGPDCDGPSDCTADRPYCVEGRCRECDGEMGCSASAPVCDVGGSYLCGACTGDPDCASYPEQPRCESASGACVECLTSAEDCLEPSRPVCSESHACRACEGDGECGSGICDEDTGACVAESDIVYVNAATGSGSACTLAAPCLTITDGVTAVTGTRRYVLVAAGSYSEFVTIDDKSLTLVGSGADLSATTAGALLTVLGASTVEIEGLRLHDALGASSGDGIRCALSGADAPTVALLGVSIDTNARRGIDSSDCALTVQQATIATNTGGGVVVSGGSLGIDRSTITGNTGGGVSMSGGLATLVNNMITANGGPTAGIGGVKLDNITGLSFDFNTVADNVTSAAFGAGIQCTALSPVVLSNTIVHGSAANQIGSPIQCSFAYSFSNQSLAGTGNLTGSPGFVNPTLGDYHLQATSLCIDAADPAATLAVDFDGDTRSGARDIGADERP